MNEKLKVINFFRLSEMSGVSYAKIAESINNKSGNNLTDEEKDDITTVVWAAWDELEALYSKGRAL